MESFKKSESIKLLACALVQAQSEIENASKNAINPHFKRNYADLSEIINTIKPVFSKNGLCFIQIPSYEGGTAFVTTILAHTSGEWISGVSSCKLQKDDPQGVGSATTYLRRYSLSAMSCITQEDDDAESATSRETDAAERMRQFRDRNSNSKQEILKPEIQFRQNEMLALIRESASLDELREKYLGFSKEILHHANCEEFAKYLNLETNKQKIILKNTSSTAA